MMEKKVSRGIKGDRLLEEFKGKVSFSEDFFEVIPENWEPVEGAMEDVKRQIKEQMPEALRKAKQTPFSRVFQQFSPKEFVFKFRDEKIQTLAFILSFAPKNYRRKAVMLIKGESRRKMLIESIGSMEHIAPPSDFIAELEKAILE